MKKRTKDKIISDRTISEMSGISSVTISKYRNTKNPLYDILKMGCIVSREGHSAESLVAYMKHNKELVKQKTPHNNEQRIKELEDELELCRMEAEYKADDLQEIVDAVKEKRTLGDIVKDMLK